jgi:transposase
MNAKLQLVTQNDPPCNNDREEKGMEVLLERCCGLDVHKDIVQACILVSGEEMAALHESFGSIRSELSRMCMWLKENHCMNVAMESTGVYWLPIFDQIEEEIPEIQTLMVVNPAHMRNLPGRKSDVKDAEWIAQLLQHGLLSKSFIPDKDVRIMREISRYRIGYVNERTRAINRLEKFLQRHGFRLSSVMNSIVGVSGLKVLDVLSKKGMLTLDDVRMCSYRNLKRKPEEIYAAINGKLNEMERVLLSELLDWIRKLDEKISRFDAMLEEASKAYEGHLAIAKSIPGINQDSALAILAEISPTPQQDFSTASRLCSWAGLVPRNDESAGKIKSRKILHGNPYVKSMLVQCAWGAVKCRSSEFAKWFWVRQGRIGQKKAIIAVARKILSLLYLLLQTGQLYDPTKQVHLPSKAAPASA